VVVVVDGGGGGGYLYIQAGAEIDPGHTREYVHSVKFPLSVAAQNALRNLTPAQNYAQIVRST
jgi:hypothetical protein